MRRKLLRLSANLLRNLFPLKLKKLTNILIWKDRKNSGSKKKSLLDIPTTDARELAESNFIVI